jgi:hypothetical protein
MTEEERKLRRKATVSRYIDKHREKIRAKQREWYYSKRGREWIKAWTRKRYLKGKQFIYSYLESHPCVDCGERDVRVLDFDHVKGKTRNVQDLLMGTVARIQSEITRCEVRCANCHRRRHWVEKNTAIDLTPLQSRA